MLKRAPYQVPSGEDEGKSRQAESELHTLHIQTGGITVSMKEDNRGGFSEVPSPRGKKRVASKDLETGGLNKGKELRQRALPQGRPHCIVPANEPALHQAVSFIKKRSYCFFL